MLPGSGTVRNWGPVVSSRASILSSWRLTFPRKTGPEECIETVLARVVEDAVPALLPVESSAARGPEALGSAHRTSVDPVVDAPRPDISHFQSLRRGG